jgi:hypothetical protein
MRQRLRSHLTYANVLATLAIFLLLGGGAYAGFHLPRNSVRSENIENGQVKTPDLADDAVTAAKLETPARFKEVGLPDSPTGNCGSLSGWVNIQPDKFTRVGYYRAPDGIVHLRGYTRPCVPHSVFIFRLPPGYRPSRDNLVIGSGPQGGHLIIYGVDEDPNNSKFAAKAGDILPSDFDDPLPLDGITFRCGPPGKNGCP